MIASIFSLMHSRLELIGVELAEERDRIVAVIFLGLVAVTFAMLALITLTALIAVAFWDSYRWQVLAALTGVSAGACQVPADARAAAAVLVGAIQAKKLNFLEPRYQQQVFNMADGTATPPCTIDAHVLQLIVVAVQSFQQVGVSDLNRRCTGMTPGAGTASAHWKGKAVDFYAINRQSLTGADALSVQLIRVLDPYAPHGSSVGQSDCRSRVHVTLGVLVNFTGDFPDTCNHQHIQVP